MAILSPSFLTFQAKKLNLYKITITIILSTISYLAGFQNFRGTISIDATPSSSNTVFRCAPANHKTTKLDFGAHHFALIPPSPVAREHHFPPCDPKYSEYTPCEDAKRSLRFDRRRVIYRERHCPESHEILKCRVPAPHGYKVPFKWPESRESAWYANVPHKDLTVEKKNQNWVRVEGERLRFPGGGTMFPRGADAYIDDIGKLINLKDGSIRTAIDTGCGVASWGAYLLSRNILTVSFAPRDTHVSQVQFALERGVPALIGILASIRLPYPSRSFDMAHCSRCLIPWGQYDGQYLIEIDRILRPGGYWILSGPPINWETHWRGWNRTREDLQAEQSQIERVAKSLCWRKLNPDMAWYTKMETCLTPLPEVASIGDIAGGQLAKWPERLEAIPSRISGGSLEGVTANNFVENSRLWKKRVAYYKKVDFQLAKTGRYRNLLDMNAHLGGFAAALVDDPVWVMNVVPVQAKMNTLGVIFQRGLIGTYQNWCEAMSTYPRTYDFVHADSLFSLYKNRCDMEDILLEMDRILRPEGSVIIRDDVDILLNVKAIIDVMQWDGRIADHEDGPHEREKILFATKKYWTAPNPDQDQGRVAD
ncbi:METHYLTRANSFERASE PMT15-RELATED [Salix koriyanagi]|uniref:Methyltransferase n=1 Tax=Salix koriyanagi TaxID=2511006 RepID=A0A9Q0YTU5_9ROSI|nr:METHYLTRANSFERASE PMT15-RELATED [Salix koriyanagi]